MPSPDRVERPETYKQWQARNDRAGLRQLPLDPDIVKAVSDKVRDNYHRDFVIYVDQNWLLQGWKGSSTTRTKNQAHALAIHACTQIILNKIKLML